MPKIQLKTITQQSFELDIEDSSTIVQLKKKIEETKGASDYPVASQKLIYNGKVLEDDKIVGELNIAPGKFIVVMVVKKMAPKTITAPTTTTSTDETKKPSNEEAGAKKEGTPGAKKEGTPSKDKQGEVPAEYQQAVDNITAMGYPREEVIRALKAAFWNADRAVEYLCTGIPEGLNLVQGAEEEASGGESGGEANVEELTGAQGLDFLANLPQFALLREMIRNDPTALPQIMQQIAENRPELMDMIRNNQDQFLALLNADVPEGGVAAQPAAVVGGSVGGGAAAAAGGGAGGGGHQAVTIPVTANDREAIERLCGMGFPEQLVIEAYLACDKNETLAVNYILQRMEENQGGN